MWRVDNHACYNESNADADYDFGDRLDNEELTGFLDLIIEAYSIGSYVKHDPTPLDFEDYNVKLVTTEGEWLVKIFAHSRTQASIERYGQILTVLSESPISAPRIRRLKGANTIFSQPEGVCRR